MDPEKHQDLVPLYVLGGLQAAERTDFETALRHSEHLQAEVRWTEEALAAVAGEVGAGGGPAPSSLWAGIEARIRLSDTHGEAGAVASAPVVGSARRSLPAWFWPAAAAALLALNLAQWFRPTQEGSGGEAGRDRGTAPVAGSREVAVVEGGMDAGAGGVTEAEGGVAGEKSPGDAAGSGPTGAADVVSSEELRRLRADHERLAAEHADLMQIVLPVLSAALLETQRDGVWSAELRPATQAADGSVSGLWARARELAPRSGVGLLPDRWRVAGAVVLDPAAWPSGMTGGTELHGESGPLPAPYAVALLNPEEGLGYVDLYNLPLLPAGRSMYLWLQAEGATGLIPIGRLPAVLAGRSGALVFRLPEGAGEPVRVVVTQEAGVRGAQPSERIIIQGP